MTDRTTQAATTAASLSLGYNNISGTIGDDVLGGTAGNDIFHLYRGGGADIAQGGAGDDSFLMGRTLTAADRIDGGTGVDTVNLDGNYTSLVLEANTITNVENLWLSVGWNYNVKSHDGNLAAGQVLSVFANRLGVANSAVFDGSAETDGHFRILGGAGNDTLTGGAQADDIDGGAGNDTINGGGGNDILRLYGGGNDIVNGGDGNDTILMGDALAAGDRIDGGAGMDTVNLVGNSAALLLAATTITNVENLWLSAGWNYNVKSHDGTVAAGQVLNVLASVLGAANSAVFDGSAETDGHFRILGGAGNDALTGGAQADDIDGGAGNDTINGGGGNDILRLYGGGDDIVSGGDGNDTILMGDALTAGDRIDGGAGNDTLNLGGVGTVYWDRPLLLAEVMANVENIWVAPGSSYWIANATNTVAPGQTLTVDATALGPTDTLWFVYPEWMYGTGAFDLRGGAGDDSLSGGSENDVITGNGGNDDLVDGFGSDVMTGGNGNDGFVVTSRSLQDWSLIDLDVDVITDFDDFGNDFIYLAESEFWTFDDLLQHMTQVGDDVRIDTRSVDILLLDTTLDSLGADDFVFIQFGVIVGGG